jgi:hypothetical protein
MPSHRHDSLDILTTQNMSIKNERESQSIGATKLNPPRGI